MSHSFSVRVLVALFFALASAGLGPTSSIAAEATATPSNRQVELEAALAKTLSNATLEGSFTNTGKGSDPAKLSREKYTLGEVKKVSGDIWQIPARIEYGGKDVTIPIMLPIRWAGDTPVVTVDDLSLPGFGTVSARVMFFGGHYSGYWKHGDHGGNMFGVIHPAKEKTGAPPSTESHAAK
jgi:hypothetical protein